MKLMELERNQEICCLPCRCNFMVYCLVSIPPFLTNQTKQHCSYCLNTIHKTKALLTILDAEPRRVRESLTNSCQVISFFFHIAINDEHFIRMILSLEMSGEKRMSASNFQYEDNTPFEGFYSNLSIFCNHESVFEREM